MLTIRINQITLKYQSLFQINFKFMRNCCLTLFVLITSFSSFFSQSDLSVQEIRMITIELIDVIHLFENRLKLKKINFKETKYFTKELEISNDLYFDNDAVKIINIKDYYTSKIKEYRTQPTIKFKILEIEQPKKSSTFDADSLYQISVKVQKLTSKGEFKCNSQILAIPADTIFQEFTMVAKKHFFYREQSISTIGKGIKNQRWDIQINKIETINSKGLVIDFELDSKHFTSLFKKSFVKRFGLDLYILDSNYKILGSQLLSNFKDYGTFKYYLKDLNKRLFFNEKLSFNNYDELRNTNNNSIEKNECTNILKIPIKNYGKIGYFEFGYGLNLPLNSSTNLSLGKNNLTSYQFDILTNYNNINHFLNIDYNIYLPNKFIFNVGFSASIFDFIFSTNSNQFTENYSSIDPDGSFYNRIVSYQNFNESYNVNYLALGPKVGINYELKNHNKLNSGHSFLNVFANYKIQHMVCNSAISNRESLINYSGLYSDYFNILISENGVYDFGEFQLEQNNILEKETNNIIHRFSLGLKMYPFSKNNIFISSCFEYNYLSKPIFSNNQNLRLSSNPYELNSFFANTSSSKFRYSSLSISIGVKIN